MNEVINRLLADLAVNFFNNANAEAQATSKEGVHTFNMIRTPAGGYKIKCSNANGVFETYTTPTRALNLTRLKYDLTKVIRASLENNVENYSRVKKVSYNEQIYRLCDSCW